MKRVDVVVIGAGLAGLQCARSIAQRGWSVVIVDRKQSPEQYVHTTGIFVRRTFEEFGFPPSTLGPAIRRVSVHSASGRTAVLESSRDEFRVGRMQLLYARMLQEARASGAEFIGGASFAGLHFGATDVRVALRRGNSEETIAGRLVVGADGASSRVASALGLDPPGAFLTGVEEVYRRQRDDAIPQLHCFLDPSIAPGYIAWIADDGEELHAGAAGISGQFQGAAALARVRELVRTHAGISCAADEIRGGRIPVCGILREIATTRGLLVGDAAGAVSPLTAGGLDAAVRLATFAAQAIDEALVSGADLSRLYSGDRFRARFVSRLWMRRLYTLVAGRASGEMIVAALRSPLFRPFGEKLFFGHGSFPIPAEELAAGLRGLTSLSPLAAAEGDFTMTTPSSRHRS